MFKISLRNDKSFFSSSNETIFEAAKKEGIVLEHSCLSARCRSCIVKILEGKTVNSIEETILSDLEKGAGHVLSCNAKPISNLKLDVEDLGTVNLQKARTLPAKIDVLEQVTKDVIKLVLRVPPNSQFRFLSGQYVNIIRGSIKRSYSIANVKRDDNRLEFYIKNYQDGLMSDYLFNQAKENDLLRFEGPLGTFFHREKESIENIVFLATGTGIAPVKAILEELYFKKKIEKKTVWIFWGVRNPKDFFWEPEFTHENIKFIPVISRESEAWEGERGYVQNVFINRGIQMEGTQVYACGSNTMIKSARLLLQSKGLVENEFYSDAFVSSN